MKAKVLSGVLIGLAVFVIVLLVAVEKGYVCTIPGEHVVAILRAIPTDVMVGEPVQLDGRDSYVARTRPVPSIPITKYQWDFTNNNSYDYEEEKYVNEDGDGDGIFGSTTHVYTEAGDYTAKLRATSAPAGDSEVAYATVHVHAPPDDLYVGLSDECWGEECDGSSWELAFPTLQDALAVAEFGGKILVAGWSGAGITYYPDEGVGQIPDDRYATFELVEGVTVEGGYAGLWGDPDERDIGKYKTILSGDIDQDDEGGVPDGENSYMVVKGANGAVLDGFTITGGNGDDEAGGIYCLSVSPTISNCVITGNKSSGSGGGMYTSDVSRGPTLINCFFIDNEGGGGGGIYIEGNINKVDITGCVFSGNKATGTRQGDGGGIFGQGEVTLTNCTFYGNEASGEGGGVYVYGRRSDMTIVNSIFRGNKDEGGQQDESSQIHIDSGSAEVSYSCIEDYQVDGPLAGEGNIGDDPEFVMDGGTIAGDDDILGTRDDGLRLCDGIFDTWAEVIINASPCMGAGDDEAVPDAVDTDIKGDSRFYGGVDMGAYEFYYETGSDCDTCEDCTDPLWGEGDKPKCVLVEFSGMSACCVDGPQLFKRAYILTEAGYCGWICAGNLWGFRDHIVYNAMWTSTESHLSATDGPATWFYFKDTQPEVCQTTFINEYEAGDCGPCNPPVYSLKYMYEGTAEVRWGEGINYDAFLYQWEVPWP